MIAKFFERFSFQGNENPGGGMAQFNYASQYDYVSAGQDIH